MLSIGVVGATNAGKSTLLNALFGQRILPSGRMSCTSVLVHCLLDGGSTAEEADAVGDAVLVREGEDARGATDVRRALDVYNQQAREDSDGRVIDVLVRVGGRPELRAVSNGRLKFMDVPGHNETDNPAVRECKDVVMSLCHGLIVTVKHDQINSDETAQLVESIARDAPHLFQTRDGRSALAFAITQVDLFEAECPDDDDDDDIAEKPGLTELKSKFREFLRQREILHRFPGWVEHVDIFGVAVSKEILLGRSLSHDFEPLLTYILDLQRRRQDLIEARKVVHAGAIDALFSDALALRNSQQAYPIYARDVLMQHDRHVRRKVVLTISAGTLLVGGWMAWSAWAVRGIAIAHAASTSAAAVSSSAAAAAAGAEALSAATAAASATATAESALATAASISATASTVGSYATGVSTVATIAVDGGAVGSTIVGAAVGSTAQFLSWTALGGASASKAASAATTAAAAAAITAQAAAATETSALAAAAVASASASNAAAAVTSATTAAAGLTGLALAGGAATVRAALAGNETIITAPDLGCLGAERAVNAISVPTKIAIENSERGSDRRPYEDFLTWPGSDDRVLYVGHFRGKLPHGRGRLFWEDTQVESFIGEFKDGNIEEGVFISKRQVAIGSLRRQGQPDGEVRLIVSGFQPESVYDPREPCVICLENPTILMEGRVMLPCHHGCVCTSCFTGLQECPLCRSQIQGDIRVC